MMTDRLTDLRTRMYALRKEFRVRRNRGVRYRTKLWRDYRLYYAQYSVLLDELNGQ